MITMYTQDGAFYSHAAVIVGRLLEGLFTERSIYAAADPTRVHVYGSGSHPLT